MSLTGFWINKNKEIRQKSLFKVLDGKTKENLIKHGGGGLMTWVCGATINKPFVFSRGFLIQALEP